jgi:inositol transport system ATP-binding protein
MPQASAAPQDTPLLEVRSVSKAFPGVVALEDVSLKLRRGTVHALIGENGAGKSTLMKIIAGLCTADAGELRLAGAPVSLRSARQALEQGIAMIHQELNLMPSMSVAENIWIGREPVNALGVVRHGELNRRTRALLERLALTVDPEAPLGTLSIAERQLVEIAKALSYRSRLIIMDEPTSALSEADAARLFAIIRELKAAGTGILYITHRLEELSEIADEISVLRDGRYVGGGAAAGLSRDEIIRMMVGRELTRIFPGAPTPRDEVVLAARHLSLAPHFSDVSFELRAGEILGVAGLVGSGRSKLAEALFGLSPAAGGTVTLAGEQVRIRSPREALDHGLALVTEDRKESGCFLALSVLENLEIALLDRGFARAGFVRARAVRESCAAMSRSLRVKTAGLDERIENLSGGNQQKVLIGRCLLVRPRILILDEPTRGVDVGAKSEIHELIASLAASGTAVLMISSELPEILGMSHRIMVMREGRLGGILERSHADPVSIMRLAAG